MRGPFSPERLGFLGAVAVLLIAVLNALGGKDASDPGGIDRPPPAPARVESPRRPEVPAADTRQRRPLPPVSRSDPAIRVEIGEKGNSIGTAFAIGDGWWMTARHVLDGCDRYGVVRSQRSWERGTDRFLHEGADIAVFRTSRQGPRLDLADRGLSLGETGYMIGYPQGKPAAVIGELMGRSRMASRGRYAIDEPVVAWAEVARVPDFPGELGGISGGPALSASGELIGVAVAASKRRGRIFTSALATLRGVWGHVPGRRDAGAATHPALRSTDDAATVSRRLFAELSVAKVVCRVE